jgi:hypothetical protein
MVVDVLRAVPKLSTALIRKGARSIVTATTFGSECNGNVSYGDNIARCAPRPNFIWKPLTKLFGTASAQCHLLVKR